MNQIFICQIINSASIKGVNSKRVAIEIILKEILEFVVFIEK